MPDQIPEPTELIYTPEHSTAPIFISLGLLFILGGLITWGAFSLVGLGLTIFGISQWIKATESDIEMMRREQRIDTAVIPAKPVQR